MAPRQSSLSIYRAVVFAATVFAVAAAIFLLDNNLYSHPDRFQESDYIMTFYVAGHLAAWYIASRLHEASAIAIRDATLPTVWKNCAK